MVLCKNNNRTQASYGFSNINYWDFVIFHFVCLFVAFLTLVNFYEIVPFFSRTRWVFRVAESRELQFCDSVMHSLFKIYGEKKKNPHYKRILKGYK